MILNRISEAIARKTWSTVASELLSGDADLTDTDPAICVGIVATSLIRINTPRLAAFEELVGTGRLNIIRSPELLSALISLEQYRSALASLVTTSSSDSSLVFLPMIFPGVIETSTYLETGTGEIRIGAVCDLEAMRANPAFLNQFNYNADSYDVFIRDGLKPWNDQFSRVHDILDEALGIEH